MNKADYLKKAHEMGLTDLTMKNTVKEIKEAMEQYENDVTAPETEQPEEFEDTGLEEVEVPAVEKIEKPVVKTPDPTPKGPVVHRWEIEKQPVPETVVPEKIELPKPDIGEIPDKDLYSFLEINDMLTYVCHVQEYRSDGAVQFHDVDRLFKDPQGRKWIHRKMIVKEFTNLGHVRFQDVEGRFWEQYEPEKIRL